MVVMRMEMMMVVQQRVSNDQESSQLTKAQDSSSYNTTELLHVLCLRLHDDILLVIRDLLCLCHLNKCSVLPSLSETQNHASALSA